MDEHTARASNQHVFENAFYECVRDYKRKRSRNRNSKQNKGVIDTSYVKNVFGCDVVGKNPTDRGRKATKVSLLVDGTGTPLATTFHRGNRHDCKTLKHSLNTAERHVGVKGWLSSIYGDKGYDSSECRTICKEYGARPIIPKRGTKETNPRHNATRIVVEHTFGRLDQFRRIRVRFDTRIQNFKSFHYFACGIIVCERTLSK